MTDDGSSKAGLDDLNASLRAPLLKVFPAALLGRVVTIPYYPLSDEMIEAPPYPVRIGELQARQLRYVEGLLGRAAAGAWVRAWVISRRIWALIPFITSGRLSVMVRTPASRA